MCLGIPGQIVELCDPGGTLALVEIGGVRRQINISLVVDEEHRAADCVGSWVLVHVGFAMSRLDEGEAMRTLELLEELGETQAELDRMQAAASS